MELAIAFMFGLSIGVIFSFPCSAFGWGTKHKTSGTLRIDTSDPDGPYMFLELGEGLRDITQKKEIILKVVIKDYIPHE